MASFPAGFRATGPYLRQQTFKVGGRRFALRYAPRPGNAILTERTVPAPVVLGTGIATSVLPAALLWLLGELAALYREVGRLARTDSLTGVADRRGWDEEFPRELTRAARSGRPLCLALLDLDHFKDYNDRHGHQAGNRLLKAAAAAWQEIAERLRTAHPDGTCSIGVAPWDRRESPAELVARALYAAKEGGRNRCHADVPARGSEVALPW